MAISRVSATYYIIKTFENYGSKSTKGKEGELNESGQKRVECFAGLIGSKVNKLDQIFYKGDGKDKNGNVKTVNSRKNTAEAIAAKLNMKAEAIEGTTTSLSTIKPLVEQYQNVLFVWSDKDKAAELATALGATGVPEKFDKDNYGSIWVVDGTNFSEVTMDCQGLSNTDKGKSGSSATARVSFMTLAVAAMSAIFLLF